MKTILVPIDYSPCADNAVNYSIQMAKIIHANIHLCHAIAIPELSPIAGMVTWPLEDYETIKADAEEMMLSYIKKLKIDEDSQIAISYSIEMTSIKQLVNKLITEKKVDLVVMGMSGAGAIDRFLLGSATSDFIEKTRVPLLLVPKHSKYLALKKIAFATDLSKSDINSIYFLARLFCLYNPEILLTHISNHPSDFHHPNSHSNLFLNEVTSKINYSKIYFRHIEENNIDEGLTWLTEHAQINMLCMIHRQKSNLFLDLFMGSHTHKMAKTIELPLLVMPEID